MGVRRLEREREKELRGGWVGACMPKSINSRHTHEQENRQKKRDRRKK